MDSLRAALHARQGNVGHSSFNAESPAQTFDTTPMMRMANAAEAAKARTLAQSQKMFDDLDTNEDGVVASPF